MKKLIYIILLVLFFDPSILKAQATWIDNDIGVVGVTGSGSYGATTTVSGGGTSVGGISDSCNFLYPPSYGSVEITAHLSNLTNTGPLATAGLMIRESTGTNAAGVYLNTLTTGAVIWLAKTMRLPLGRVRSWLIISISTRRCCLVCVPGWG